MPHRPFSLLAILFIAMAQLVPTLASAVIRDGGIDPANLGKGDWIYFMSAATNKLGGNVTSVTNEASLMKFYKQQGVRYLIVKAADSDRLFPVTNPQLTTNLVNFAHAEGLLIFGYNRSWGSNVVGEIAISDYVFNQGADGFVFDAEGEWESSRAWIGTNGPAKAWQLCSNVRSNWPNKFLAHAPFPVIDYHSSFPYKEFGFWCDTVMPQIYPFNWTNVKSRPSGGINWADANFRRFHDSLLSLPPTNINGVAVNWTNAVKPLAPVNHVYGPNPPNTGVSHIDDFYVMEFVDYLLADPNSVTAGGYKGANFWRSDLHGAKQWENIAINTIGDFPDVVNNIVIDDHTAARGGGTWDPVKVFSDGTYFGATGADINPFGTNYLVKSQGNGSAYVEYKPNLIHAGQYDLYQWHVYREDASAGVPFEIGFYGGSATVFANQTTNAGRWSLLGRFNFDAGTNGTIRVTDGFADAGKVAVADGFKMTFVYPTAIAATPTGLTANAVSTTQINLGWSDVATNEAAYVVARSTSSGGPYVDIARLPPNATTFNDVSLTSNTTYYYVVRTANYLGASGNSTQASATTSGAPAPPTIISHPQDQTVAAGMNLQLSVTASGSQPLFYQWRVNGNNITNASGATLQLNNVSTNQAGNYSVVVSNAYNTATSGNAVVSVNPSFKASGATTLWTLGGGARPYLSTTAYTERGLAYNPLSNRLLLVQRGATPKIFVINGDTGADLHEMNVDPVVINGSSPAGYGILMIGAAEDGVVYAGNLTTAGAATAFRLYRWADDAAATVPTLAYFGNPGGSSNQRWGDTFDVRGFGKHTQVLLGSRAGGAVSILTTVDGTNFTANPVVVADAHPVNFGLGVAFGVGETFWGKATNLPLRQVAFDLNAGIGTTIRIHSNNFPARIAPIGVNANLHLLAGIEMETPEMFKLFDLTLTNGAPILLSTAGFATANANTFLVGSVDFGRDRVYALDPNNGIVALQITVSSPRPPTIFHSLDFLTNGAVALSLTGQPGAGHWIERSPDLAQWVQLTNIVNTNGSFGFIDLFPGIGHRYYRARE